MVTIESNSWVPVFFFFFFLYGNQSKFLKIILTCFGVHKHVNYGLLQQFGYSVSVRLESPRYPFLERHLHLL